MTGEENVQTGKMASGRPPSYRASNTRSKPDVAEFTATTLRSRPKNWARSASKALATCPVVSQPDFRTSITASTSSEPMSGLANGTKLSS
jgi:hypothetical protein